MTKDEWKVGVKKLGNHFLPIRDVPEDVLEAWRSTLSALDAPTFFICIDIILLRIKQWNRGMNLPAVVAEYLPEARERRWRVLEQVKPRAYLPEEIVSPEDGRKFIVLIKDHLAGRLCDKCFERERVKLERSL